MTARVPSEQVVLVCGGGAAGMAAAIAAARAGADTCLVESTENLGGTVANVLIHTIGGLFDSAGEFLNQGLARELAERLQAADSATCKRRLGRAFVLNACPDVYRAVAQQWIAAEPRITVWTSTRVHGLATTGNRIAEAVLESSGSRQRIGVRSVIDCTGSGEIVRRLNPALMQHDPSRAAGGLIVRMRNVAPRTLDFPRGLAVIRALREAAACGKLPPDCAKAWVDSGVQSDEAFLKLMVAIPEDWRNGPTWLALRRKMEATAAAVLDLLRQLPGFHIATEDRVGVIGIRDGGRVRGNYCLTETDVRECRKFPDAACRCAWPIEFWDPDSGVTLEYLPDGGYYEIPQRALRVEGVSNLFAAGKCLSADRRAQASARVVGTCWAMGEAAGKLAALEGAMDRAEPG